MVMMMIDIEYYSVYYLIWDVAGCQAGGPLLLRRPILTGLALITPMFWDVNQSRGWSSSVWSIRVALQ